MKFETKLLSSLEKVFLTKDPTVKEFDRFSCLRGERFSFQLAVKYIPEGATNRSFQNTVVAAVNVSSDFENINIYSVENVPVDSPCFANADDYYISKEPGLYPDALRYIKTRDNSVRLPYSRWRSLWFEIDVPEDMTPGKKEITITLTTSEGELIAEKHFSLTILDAVLPKEDFKCTLWFHNDCLVNWYKVPALSEEHWRILGNYMANYRRYGCSMILTPIFTPALDTYIGGERTTVQLVDVTKTDSGYKFAFDKLGRYIDLAHSHGIKYFEIAHLFTQWGAKATPKVITTEGERIFGWDVSATSEEYRNFILPLLDELKAYLREKGVLENCYFHVSDEPNTENIEFYKAAHDVVCDALADCNVMDALSEYKFYEDGLVRLPIPSINHIGPFLEKKVSPLWTYYCCGQGSQYEANRFIAMPSARNRILGLQLYKYNIDGFLQWGYNFWNAQHSRYELDPYYSTSSDFGFQSGDASIVYPLDDGTAMPSLRQIVFHEALQDLFALRLLERYMSHEEIVAWLEKLSGQKVTFTDYPHGSEYLLFIREAINNKISELA